MNAFEAVQRLRQAGMDEAQANGVVEVMAAYVAAELEPIKASVERLDAKVTGLSDDVRDLRADMSLSFSRLDTRLAENQVKMSDSIGSLRSDMLTRMHEGNLKSVMIVVPVVVGLVTVVGGLLVKYLGAIFHLA